MRATTHVGLTFVGPHSKANRTNEDNFKPKAIAPDKSHQIDRDAYTEALAEKLAFWRDEIEQWADEFPKAIERLEQLVGR